MTANTSPAVDTLCVHAGFTPDSLTSGASTPIYPATANGECPSTGTLLYPRYLNLPNHRVVAAKLASLEQGEAAIITSSGMAAISTALYAFLKPGDHVIFPSNIYGGTDHLARQEFPQFGIETTFLTSDAIDELEAAIRPNTRLIYLETPSNPLLKLQDLKAVAKLAQARGILTMIDNTFATPLNQTPLTLGIDVVVHSATKYLNGHSDLLAGGIVARQELMDQILPLAINRGGCLNAHDLFLLERGMKTLALRMERHNTNALELAKWLREQPQVKQVNYPGLPQHPQHSLARQQMRGFGGMLSFELDADAATTQAFVLSLNLFFPAGSLGGVESLVSIPARASHAKMSKADREAIGITDSLVRVSVGIEAIEDLKADLAQALTSVKRV